MDEIQAYLSTHSNERPASARQRLLKARQVSRSKTETITNLKTQRDDLASRLVEAHELILALTHDNRHLRAKLEDIQPSASISTIPFARPKANPRVMDIPYGK